MTPKQMTPKEIVMELGEGVELRRHVRDGLEVLEFWSVWADGSERIAVSWEGRDLYTWPGVDQVGPGTAEVFKFPLADGLVETRATYPTGVVRGLEAAWANGDRKVLYQVFQPKAGAPRLTARKGLPKPAARGRQEIAKP